MKVYTVCHSQQSNQGLHYLSFSAIWSGSTLFAILSKQFYHGLHCFLFLAVRSGSTSFAILSSLIRVYTVCHSQQSGQGLHYLLFSVWSASTLFAILSSLIRAYTICHSFYAALSRSTLFAILSILIRVYTTCHSQQSDEGQGLLCHSHEQSDQGLHYLPFSAVWSRTTLFAILSSLIKVKVNTLILRNCLVRVYTICHSQKSDLGLHCLPFSPV